jgi:hypothetical protein
MRSPDDCGWLRRGAILALIACSASVEKAPPQSPEPSTAEGVPTAETPRGTEPQAAAPVAAAASPVEPPPEPAPPAEPELIVGSKRGLEAWSTDGKRKRLISAGAAFHPRFLDESSVLVISNKHSDLSRGATLQRVSLTDGKRETVARLPKFDCGPAPEAETLNSVDVQSEDDVSLDPEHRAVCLHLHDRNENMANLSLAVHVDLSSGKVERWLSVGDDVCKPPRDVILGDAPGSCPYRVPPPASERSFEYGMNEDTPGQVQHTTASGVQSALEIQGYYGEKTSPSGRWLVLAGDETDGDYLYRSLILLDREQGQVFPIPHPKGRWPAALRPKGPKHTIETPIEKTVQVTGESDIRWFGDGAPLELLIVEGSLVNPGVGTFTVGGQIAQ